MHKGGRLLYLSCSFGGAKQHCWVALMVSFHGLMCTVLRHRPLSPIAKFITSHHRPSFALLNITAI
eukprot:14735188-Heterocapsa_arctica.AAC.1